MPQKIYYLETGSTDPAFNLAFEEYVLTHRTAGDYLLLWQNDNTIVVGQNQNVRAEIDADFVREHGIRVVRRSTGGGAVYQDLGNLNYSFLTDVGDAARLTLERFTTPVVEALKSLGIQAEASGRNDILADGRKVSGTAQRIVGGRILHHGTLLFDSNLELLTGALRADPEKFRSKAAKSVRSRVGNIRSLLSVDMDMEEFWIYLISALARDGLEQVFLSKEELTEVERLKQEKYGSWEWNYGRAPQYDMTAKHRWDGGTLEINLQVKDGRIKGIAFWGDFLSMEPLTELTDSLCGIPYRQPDLEAALDRFDLSRFFGRITRDEILETLFGQ